MNWIETLYRTYENNTASIGCSNDKIPLAPVAHTVQQTFIEITVDQDGVFRGAKAEPLITVIPCSEASAGRTNSPVAHPLVDKLHYVAGDFLELTGEKPKKASEKSEKKSHHEEYRHSIDAWANSAFSDPKLKAIQKYLDATGGKILADLCRAGIYPLSEDNLIPKKWQGDKDKQPAIYALTKNAPAPWDAFVRWRVTIPGILEDRTYFDRNLWDKWSAFYLSKNTETGVCYVTGDVALLAKSHPKRIRNIADGAKLISSNDSSGFTFRGRFTDPDGAQVCGVGFDVTQKAHNALRWLIARQGRRDGDQAIVAWAVSGKDVPPLIESTDSLFGDESEGDLAKNDQDQASAIIHAEVAQAYALKLKSKIGGYHATLGDAETIVVLALDSATPGRISITYYREIASSEFLERIEQWHTECAWFQDFGKDRKFIGAPAPFDIAQCAFGGRLDDKLKASTLRRILPCIVDAVPLPNDLIENCIRRAIARQSMDHWEWVRALGIACALYRKQQINLNHHHHPMSLERDRKTRDYLYGRLLAVADQLESGALYSAGEKRESSASRLMQRFADYPFSTWRTIELALVPYQQRLKSNSPGLLSIYEREFQEIMEKFTAEEFAKDERLTGEFLLAFHTQRTALWTKQPKDSPEEATEESN